MIMVLTSQAHCDHFTGQPTENHIGLGTSDELSIPVILEMPWHDHERWWDTVVRFWGQPTSWVQIQLYHLVAE